MVPPVLVDHGAVHGAETIVFADMRHKVVQVEVAQIVFAFFRGQNVLREPAYLFLEGALDFHVAVVRGHHAASAVFQIRDEEILAQILGHETDTLIPKLQLLVFIQAFEHVLGGVAAGYDDLLLVLGSVEEGNLDPDDFTGGLPPPIGEAGALLAFQRADDGGQRHLLQIFLPVLRQHETVRRAAHLLLKIALLREQDAMAAACMCFEVSRGNIHSDDTFIIIRRYDTQDTIHGTSFSFCRGACEAIPLVTDITCTGMNFVTYRTSFLRARAAG